MRRKLTDINWDINDRLLRDTLEIKGINLNKEQFVKELSERRQRWIEDSNNPGTIVFLYDIENDPSKSTRVIAIRYNISDLGTALDVIGAISTFYDKNMVESSIDLESDIIITAASWPLFLTVVKKTRALLAKTSFFGLTMISPGIYHIDLLEKNL